MDTLEEEVWQRLVDAQRAKEQAEADRLAAELERLQEERRKRERQERK